MQQRNGPFDNYEFCALVVQVQLLYCDKFDQNKLGKESNIILKKTKTKTKTVVIYSLIP